MLAISRVPYSERTFYLTGNKWEDILIPEICESVTIDGKKREGGGLWVIKIKVAEMERLSWTIWWAQPSHMNPQKLPSMLRSGAEEDVIWKNGQRDTMLPTLKMMKGNHESRNMGDLQKLEKARKWVLLSRTSRKEDIPADTF